MDVSRIKSIVDQLAGSAAQEVRLRSGQTEIQIRFAAPQPGSVPAGLTPSAQDSAEADLIEVCAPMPGLTYLAAAPDEAPFVTPGQSVEAGQTLLLIEAMKALVPVTAPAAGEIVRICIDNDAPCDAGQPLVVMRRGRS